MLLLVTTLLFLCVVILLGMVMWALPRGFAVSDEGFYLLNYQKGQETTFLSGFGGIVRWLFQFTDVGVRMLRWLRLAVTILGCTALGLAVSLWSQQALPTLSSRLRAAGIILLVIVGGMVSYTFGPLSLSYNHINCLLLQLSVATLILIRIENFSDSNTRKSYLKGLCLGICLGMLWFNKPPSFIPCFGLVVLWLLFFSVRGAVRRALLAISVVVGVILLCVWYFCWVESFHDYIIRMNIGFAQGALESHGTRKLALGALADAFQTVRIVIIAIPFSYLFIGTHWGLRKVGFRPAAYHAVIGFLVLVAGLGSYLRYHHATAAVFLLATSIAVIVWLHMSIFQRLGGYPGFSLKHSDALLIGLILLMPFIGGSGTDVGLLRNALGYISFWFALIAALWFRCSLEASREEMVLLPLGILAILSVCFIFRGLILTPYLMETLSLQINPLSSKTIEPGLLIDRGKIDSINKLESLLSHSGFKRGDPIVGFGGMLGYIYLLGGRVPCSVPFHVNGYALSVVRKERHLQEYDNLYVLVEIAPEWVGHGELRSIFSDYPKQFQCIGTLEMCGIPMKLLRITKSSSTVNPTYWRGFGWSGTVSLVSADRPVMDGSPSTVPRDALIFGGRGGRWSRGILDCCPSLFLSCPQAAFRMESRHEQRAH